jgi:hypothetical protein
MNLDQAFLEKIILLVLTARITGLGVPCILKRIMEVSKKLDDAINDLASGLNLKVKA